MTIERSVALNGPRVVKVWPWAVLVGFVALPPSVLVHELGHICSYLAFGFKSPTLHYASSGFAREPEFWSLVRAGNLAAAGEIADVTRAGLSALSGLLISYLIVAIGLWRLNRSGAPVFFAVAVSSAVRFPLVLLLFILGRAEHTDEAHVAQTLGVPDTILFALGGAALLVATVGGARLLVRQRRGQLVLPVLIGVVAGTVFWMGFLGPLVLP